MICVSRPPLLFHVLNSMALLSVQLVQGTFLNHYMAVYSQSSRPYLWGIADVLCLVLFSVALVESYRHFSQRSDGHGSSRLGDLPLSYVSWFFYSVFLLARIMVIYKSDLPDDLSREAFFGPQTLKVTISLSGIVFLCLAEGHNSAGNSSLYHEYVISTCAEAGLGMLDTVDPLELLNVRRHRFFSFPVQEAVLTLCALTFFLPSVALYQLSLPEDSHRRWTLNIRIAFTALQVFLYNLPFLALRVYLWAEYSHDASIFLMKNVFSVVYALRRFHLDHSKLQQQKRKWEAKQKRQLQ